MDAASREAINAVNARVDDNKEDIQALYRITTEDRDRITEVGSRVERQMLLWATLGMATLGLVSQGLALVFK